MKHASDLLTMERERRETIGMARIDEDGYCRECRTKHNGPGPHHVDSLEDLRYTSVMDAPAGCAYGHTGADHEDAGHCCGPECPC